MPKTRVETWQDTQRKALLEILDTAIAVTDADFGDIRLRDPRSGSLRIAVQRGFPESWTTFWTPGVMGLCGVAIARGARIVVEDIEADALMAGMPSTRMLRQVGVRSVQSTPLIDPSGAPVGTFSTHKRRPFRLDARALRLLDLLARVIAETVARSHAEAALKTLEDRRRFLLDVDEALRPLEDPAAIEHEACRHLADRLDVERAYYVEIDDTEGHASVTRDFVRPGVASLAGRHRTADFAWSVDILRRGACHVVADTQSSPVVPEADRPACAALGIVACMGAPMIKGGRLVGALCVTDSRPRMWRDDDTDLLRAMGERIWAAVTRCRAEAASRGSAAALRSIFEASPAGIGILGPDDRFENANPALGALVGHGPDALRGLSLAALVHPEDGARIAREIACLRAGDVASLQTDQRWMHGSGETIWLRTSLAILPDRRSLAVVAMDISERRAIEEAHARARQMEALGQVSGGIAHDFNNLLATISLNLEMAGADASDDRLRRRLERAQSAVDAAASLTRRLLSFARRRTRATTSIQPHARIRDLEDLLRHSLGERIDLATHLDPDGWSVDVDAGELDSAIINLVANARDAMPKGGHVTITVENVGLREPETWLAHLAPGAYVRITVVDTGAGMAPEILRRATEPFFTTKPQGAGTGLGLSGIYGFARQSGGGLALESAPGRGTRACLYLPRLTAAAVAARDEALRDGPPRGRGERILVVEDNAELRATLAERLRLLGYEILEAARGRDALAMLANEGAVDLVLSDVVMPGGVDGFDVADWVCANAPRIPVILISGNMAADPRGLTRPGLRIVSKPSPFVDLAQELRAALEA